MTAADTTHMSSPRTSSEHCAAEAALRTLTVIVPAYNEAEHVGATIASLQAQTRRVDEIVVVDDGSDDGTGDVARSYGVTVLRPTEGTGSKAGAQRFALETVTTTHCMVVDADTTLAPDAIERVMAAFDDGRIAAACGFVVPRHVRTVWERGRYVEYLFAFAFYKQVQDYYGRPLISSGCFSVYRTDRLRECGAWQTRTMAEDMDLTWTMYEHGYGVRFIPEAVSYPVEPESFHFLHKQLTRWSHAFVQNLRLHYDRLRPMRYLFTAVLVAITDAVLSSLVFLVVLPLLAVFVSPWFLLGYVVDAPVIAVPVLAAAIQRGEVGKALASLPAFFLIRLVNAVLLLKAVFLEVVLRRSLLVYEKGH